MFFSFFIIAFSTNLIGAEVIGQSTVSHVSQSQDFQRNQDITSPYNIKTRPFDSYKTFKDNLRNKMSKIYTKNHDQSFRQPIRFQQSKPSRNCFFSPIQCQLNVKKLSNLKDPSYSLFNKRPNSILKKNYGLDKTMRFLVLN
uniref:Uncharacterized protein n=1 Tax=Strongyloides venezuelensis TaxID=75913 RepID=A0A0K0FMB1_STRVS